MAKTQIRGLAMIESLENRRLLTGIPYHLSLAEQLVANVPITSNAYYSGTPTVTWTGLSGATAYENQSDCATFIRALLAQAYGFTSSQFTTWGGYSYPKASSFYTAAIDHDGFAGFEQIADLQPGDAIFEMFTNPVTVNGHCMLADALPVYVSTTGNQKAYNLTIIDCTGDLHSNDSRAVIDPATGVDETGVGRGTIRLYTDLSGNLVSWAWGTGKGATLYTNPAEYFTFAKMPGTTAIPWLAAGSVATWNATTHTLAVTGPSSIVTDPNLSTGVLISATSAGEQLDIVPASGATVHIAGIALSGGATASVLGPSTSPVLLDIAAGTGNVSIDSFSQLDLGANEMIVRSGSLSTIASDVALAFHNGRWTGNGITSSTAASDSTHLTALAAIQDSNGSAAIYTSFHGVTAATTDVLVKYTYYGDANLDGKVDGSDYSRIDSGNLTSATGWVNGDFNYDGAINGSDYTLIDNTYNTQGSTIAATVAAAISTPGAPPRAATPPPAIFSAISISIGSSTAASDSTSSVCLFDQIEKTLLATRR